MSIVKKTGLVLLLAALGLLLLHGVNTALSLGFVGMLGLYIGVSTPEPLMLGYAALGLVTVALASACCGTGLVRCCIMTVNALSGKPRWVQREWIMTGLAIVFTVSIVLLLPCGIWWVLVPDVLLAGLIVTYVHDRKGRLPSPDPAEAEVIP